MTFWTGWFFDRLISYHFLYFLAISLMFSATGVAAFDIWQDQDRELSDNLVLICSALLVGSSVVFNAGVRLHGDIRKTTAPFLRKSQSSELLNQFNLIGRFKTKYQFEIGDDPTSIYLSEKEENQKFIEALFEVGNFFEQMAIGVKCHEVNERGLNEFYCGMLIRYWESTRNFMPMIRNVPLLPNHRHGKTQRPEIFINVEWLYSRWQSGYSQHKHKLIKKQTA